jgi:hypothetical protein
MPCPGSGLRFEKERCFGLGKELASHAMCDVDRDFRCGRAEIEATGRDYSICLQRVAREMTHRADRYFLERPAHTGRLPGTSMRIFPEK